MHNLGKDVTYDDIFCGLDYLDAFENGEINDYDMVVMLSMDGAQLYRNKKSDSRGGARVLLFSTQMKYTGVSVRVRGSTLSVLQSSTSLGAEVIRRTSGFSTKKLLVRVLSVLFLIHGGP